ncbi:MAG TPA: murein L,D-transpeptidase catalytic domain family protein [Thermoanaerobaculia bacterium]|nr:murein L,D-transpeptidase catalytic domain family protein [Thermoanaerobaculia bacterium]
MKLSNSSAPLPGSYKKRARGLGLRTLPFPSLLLILVVASFYAESPQVSKADAASLPVAVAVPAVQATTVPTVSEAVTTTAPEAVTATVPAVLTQGAEGLSPQVLAMALDAVASARARGISGKSDLLTVIDYSLPSTEPRLWVLDLARGKVLFHELVAHGAGSGDKVATRFSNVDDSRATSLGLFLTGDTYEGGKGYSLKLKGLDTGFNDRAEERHIVMHGAWYVSADHARQFGMLGRSWGCPALSVQDAKPVIDAIKGGSFVFSYSAADPAWLQAASSRSRGVASGSKAAAKSTS